MRIVSQKMRDSARDEECAFQIVGVCRNDPATVVLCHLPDESHGMGIKSDDLSAAYGCHECHQAVDRAVRSQELESHREEYLRRAMVRTWRRMVEKGIIKIAGVKI